MEYGQASARQALGLTTMPTVGPMTAPPPNGQVPQALIEQEKLLAVLHDNIERLDRRLAGVLTPPTPSPDRNGAGVNPIASDLAGRIRSLNDGIAHAARRLDELVNRLDF